MKKLVVLGAGVLGSQIAYQAAYKGFETTCWLRGEASIERAKPRFALWHEHYVRDLTTTYQLLQTQPALAKLSYPKGLIQDIETFNETTCNSCVKTADDAMHSIHFETDLTKAVKGASFVIEALTEDPQQKKELFGALHGLLEDGCILLTNSSTLLPSVLAPSVPQPSRFLAMHFANEIWKHNTAEIMGHPATDPSAFDATIQLAQEMGMVPLPLHKEQPGYILNSILVPFLEAGLSLWGNGVADPHTIDLTWKLATGSPVGPFQIIDIVGLKTVYAIHSQHPEATKDGSLQHAVLEKIGKKLAAGELGVESGKGFYDYTHAPRS